MDSTAITSAAQAVHQELVGKLAEQARINLSGISCAAPGPSQHLGRSLRATA
jgi:hypothetical protein